MANHSNETYSHRFRWTIPRKNVLHHGTGLKWSSCLVLPLKRLSPRSLQSQAGVWQLHSISRVHHTTLRRMVLPKDLSKHKNASEHDGFSLIGRLNTENTGLLLQALLLVNYFYRKLLKPEIEITVQNKQLQQKKNHDKHSKLRTVCWLSVLMSGEIVRVLGV